MKARQAEIAILLVVLVILSGTPILLSAGNTQTPSQPLTNLSRKPVPSGLPWYTVAVFGDNRPEAVPWVQLPDTFYRTVNELAAINAMVNIGLGDHVGQGSKRQFLEFYRVMKESGLENQMYAMGNHDVSFGRASWGNWERLIGPLYLDFDEIPGWRIGVLDTEANSTLWARMVNQTFTGAGDRSIMLAFHKPIIPYVHHNLQDDHPDMAKLLLDKVRENGHVKLVVQAHWHGWAHVRVNGTDWIISGSTGAPLYKASDCQAGVDCVSTYNYLLVILYPNGTYKYYPVRAGAGSGSITVTATSEGIVVENSKVDVHGKPTAIPVRVEFNTSLGPVYIPAIVPQDSRVIFRIIEASHGYEIETNATTYYAYLYQNGEGILLNKSNNRIVLPADVEWVKPVNPHHVLSYQEYQASQQATTTSQGRVTTTSATTQTTPKTSETGSSTQAITPTGTLTEKTRDGLTIVAGIVVVLVVLVGLAYSRISK